jgi:hypothetical protein
VARDPYIQAALAQRRNRLHAEGWLATAGSLAIPLIAAAVVVPLARRSFLGFLDDPPATWADALGPLALWTAIAVVSALSLDVFSRLIRGADREVLSLLPIEPAQVVRAQLLETAAARWWILPTAAVVLAPVAAEVGFAQWAALLAVVAGCVALGLTGSAVAHLLAIEVAESPRFAPWLDLLRGSNPRAQAAFLYAPGALVVATGALLGLAAYSVPAAATGDPVALLSLASPFGGAALAASFVPGLARRAYLRGTAVLSDIDARYAIIEDPREAGRVYLDWAVRFLPAPLRVYALDDLRHGWRTRRTFVTGGWLLALVAAGMGWTEAASGPIRAASVAVAAVFVVGASGVLLAADEPAFLRVWLPPRGLAGALARAVVLAAWAAPPVALAAAAVALRLGGAAAGPVLQAGGLGLALAVALALAAGRLRERGLALYAPVATVVGVGLIAWASTTAGGT